MRNRTPRPRTKRQKETLNRALRVKARMARTGASPTAAARAEHIDLRTVHKYLGDNLKRNDTDSLIREMFVLTALGPVSVRIRGSRVASQLGKHAAAVQHFLRSGDSSRLVPFQGERVAGYELIVDTKLLSTLAEAGALRLDDLYSTPKRTS